MSNLLSLTYYHVEGTNHLMSYGTGIVHLKVMWQAHQMHHLPNIKESKIETHYYLNNYLQP